MSRHFKGSGVRSPHSDSNLNYWQTGQNTPHSNFTNNEIKTTQKVMPERLIWSYVIQLTAAIRQIHSLGLNCRTIDASKVLLIGNSR